MLFSSISFLYYFLPVVLAVYFAVPFRLKNLVLFVSSLIFYGWGGPKYIVLMLISILSAYMFAPAIEKRRGTAAGKALVAVSAAVSLSFLAVFKYADFFVENINHIPGVSLPLPGLLLPVGISFYTFQIVSYTVDVYRGRTKAQRNFISFATYVSMFPQLIAGPIVRYSDIEREIEGRRHSWGQASYGCRRFIAGLAKKVLIANVLGELTAICKETAEPSVLLYWMYAVANVLQIYFDFSGYSDMAIGLGSIFGFTFPENFSYPLMSRSVREFWRRWHVSLGSWFRDYVYIPLGGSRVKARRLIFNTAVVWLLTGLWHGAEWNFVLWGAGFGALSLAERYIYGRFLEKHRMISHLYMIFIMCFSFMLFSAESLSGAAESLKGMLFIADTASVPAVTGQAVYYLESYAATFIIAILGATPLPAAVYKKAMQTRPGKAVIPWAEPVVLAALLVLATAFLVDGSYNPFLYFRF